MNTLLRTAAAALVSVAFASAAEPEISAAELAGRLAAKQQDGSSLIHLKMDNSGAAGGTLQLQIKSRSTPGGAELVYQVLWPKERKGEAVLLRRSENQAATGAVFTPRGGVQGLGPKRIDEPLFGSALSYEDAIENFFAWGQQAIAGMETVDRVPCQILESKPGRGDHSYYTSVRTWVDTRRMVPLRVEKYARSDKPVRWIETTRVANDDNGRPVAANITVHGPGGATTDLDGSKIKHGATFTDEEFTPDGLKNP